MTLIQLEYFMEVAQCSSMTKAAKKLYVTHSTISRSIADLERELGLPLFLRENKNLLLTEAGQLLLPLCEKIFADMDHLQTVMEEQRQQINRNIQVSIISQNASPQIFAALQQFRVDFPEVSLNLEDVDGAYLGEMLLNRKLDLAITYSFAVDQMELPDTQFARQNLFRENMCAVVNVNSEEASLDSLNPYDHKMKRPLQMENAYSPFLESMIPTAAFMEHTNKRHDEPRSINSMILSIANGSNWAILPECMAYSFASKCKILPLAGVDSSHYVTMVWRKDFHNSLVQELAAYIADEYRDVECFTPNSDGKE